MHSDWTAGKKLSRAAFSLLSSNGMLWVGFFSKAVLVHTITELNIVEDCTNYYVPKLLLLKFRQSLNNFFKLTFSPKNRRAFVHFSEEIEDTKKTFRYYLTFRSTLNAKKARVL